MLKVTVKSAKHTHEFTSLPIDWDSVEQGVEEVSITHCGDLVIHLGSTDINRKFAFNMGLNDLASGQTTTSLVVGVVSPDEFIAFEVFKDGTYRQREDFEPTIRGVLNQTHQKLVK